MSKNKKTLIAIIVILIIIVIFAPALVKRLNFAGSNTPKDKADIVFKDNSANITKSFKFQKNGCYEVGLYSKTNTFAGFLMESPDFEGDYILTYYAGNNTLQAKNATLKKDSKRTGYVAVGKTIKHSTLMLDLIEVPFKQYKNFTINLQISNSDKRLTDDIYFFARHTNLYCGKQKELREAKDIKTPERNETLMPLHNALQQQNITELKNFFKDTKLPYNITMQGNRTALHYAVYFNNANATAFLLSKDKSILDNKDISNKTALSYAIENGYIEPMRELLKYKPDFEKAVLFNEYFGAEGLMWFLDRRAQSANTKDMLEVLIIGGLDPNTAMYSRSNGFLYHYTLLDNLLHGSCSASTKRKINCAPTIELLNKYGGKTYKELLSEHNSSNTKISCPEAQNNICREQIEHNKSQNSQQTKQKH
jgi:ankyrin repeat protein